VTFTLKLTPCPDVFIYNTLIPSALDVKYLGLTLDKRLTYKSLLKPAWTYGLQLWGNANKTNINKIQTFQNIALRKILNAPPYVSNYTIHTDLKMPSVSEEAKA